MLFHVTITHSQDDCPGRRPDDSPDLIGAADRLEALGSELSVTSHSVVWGASCILWAEPEHVAYALLEAPSVDSVERYIDALTPAGWATRALPVFLLPGQLAAVRQVLTLPAIPVLPSPTTVAESPPAESLAAESPPAESPLAESPPAESPPAESPPAESLAAESADDVDTNADTLKGLTLESAESAADQPLELLEDPPLLVAQPEPEPADPQVTRAIPVPQPVAEPVDPQVTRAIPVPQPVAEPVDPQVTRAIPVPQPVAEPVDPQVTRAIPVPQPVAEAADQRATREIARPVFEPADNQVTREIEPADRQPSPTSSAVTRFIERPAILEALANPSPHPDPEASAAAAGSTEPSASSESTTVILSSTARPTPGIRLMADSGPAQGSTFDVGEAGATLGRLPDNSICLADGRLSRHHAAIEFRDGAYWLRDLGSQNGTLVNDRPLTETHRLQSGDSIELGSTRMSVLLDSDD